ncbi:MAG: hypothetical protein LBF60_07000, partial [Treponema sp.]|nr:hypothetical protein [Treponema sp.]
MIKGNENRDTKKYYEIMSITIELKRPRCHSPKITRNGKKRDGAQNHRCSCRGRRFVGDHQMTYNGCLSGIVHMVKSMLV